jgi:hypothetical protein
MSIKSVSVFESEFARAPVAVNAFLLGMKWNAPLFGRKARIGFYLIFSEITE